MKREQNCIAEGAASLWPQAKALMCLWMPEKLIPNGCREEISSFKLDKATLVYMGGKVVLEKAPEKRVKRNRAEGII